MKYRVDVKLIGWEEVMVDADTDEEAKEKALDRFWEIYSVAPAESLRWKSNETTIMDKE